MKIENILIIGFTAILLKNNLMDLPLMVGMKIIEDEENKNYKKMMKKLKIEVLE